MVLSVYDLTLNVLGHQRYSNIWWASLGIRAATYAVLLGGLLVNTAIQLQRLERYATTELDRAEGEVNSWAEVTERLLGRDVGAVGGRHRRRRRGAADGGRSGRHRGRRRGHLPAGTRTVRSVSG